LMQKPFAAIFMVSKGFCSQGTGYSTEKKLEQNA
jgi:hypothetical protein